EPRCRDRHRLVPAPCPVPDLAWAHLFLPADARPRRECPVMRRYGLAFLLACSTAAVAHAQVPFDMSPERPVQEDQTTAPELPTPPSATPRQPSSPRAMAPREYRRLLLPTGDLTLRGEMASRSWVVH